MLTLPLIVPRDSDDLWFGSSHSHRTSSAYQNQHPDPNHNPPRRNGPNNNTSTNATGSHTSTGENLSSLLLEERALRARKHNIASFGYSWIKPAGCSKTMLGMKEEEAEREEAMAAAAQEMAAAAAAAAAEEATGPGQDGEEEDEEEGMERDLDDDIPDADRNGEVDVDGLVEEGEEGFGDDDFGDEEEYMERDLDDDVPEAYPDNRDDSENGLVEAEDYEEGQFDYFDDQPDLDANIPTGGDGAAEGGEEEGIISDGEGMAHDLDDDIPEAAENGSNQGEEWQHTDTEAEFDDEDDDQSLFAPNSLRNSTSSVLRSSGLPPPPSIGRPRGRETEAQRRFLQRWSGGGDSLADSSSMMLDEEDLRASMASQMSRRSLYGRFARRNGGPRDSFD